MHVEIDADPLRPFVEQVIRETAVEGLTPLVESIVKRILRQMFAGTIGEAIELADEGPRLAKAGAVEPKKRGRPRKVAQEEGGKQWSTIADVVRSNERRGGRRPASREQWPAIADAVRSNLAMGMNLTAARRRVAEKFGVHEATVRRAQMAHPAEAGTEPEPTEETTETATEPSRPKTKIRLDPEGTAGDLRRFWGSPKRSERGQDERVKFILDLFATIPGGELKGVELHTLANTHSPVALSPAEVLGAVHKCVEKGMIKKFGNRSTTVWKLQPTRATAFYVAYAKRPPGEMVNGAAAEAN